ncbi:acyl-CoA reductase [Emticicia aquatilis]|uniref:Acyl-CoA reductase n=1 Tax=Emticicia aquatilis TaxID=1537369 RepID=A0A916YKZ3_9BACT|nr:acyl-CoA reductase [Emticicia aquatilis]GGD50205.1 acyl-CoA reductase [Emticicia aquatilis]
MQYKKHIITFSNLGEFILQILNDEPLKPLFSSARNENGWFTEDNVKLAVENIAKIYLNKVALEKFAEKYSISENNNPKKIGIVMAGNIPAVGFHDLLCTVLTGNIALIKLSSSDTATMMFLINKLFELDPSLKEVIRIAQRLNDADALIATGSDNTAKHFEYYFASKPRIIRRNRTSVAVINGNETRSELADLGNDIFQYFGLGCRNVSKLYVPIGYQFDKFYESIEYWSTIRLHHKYNNNYDYNKSIYLVNRVPHLDNGFLILKEDEALVSPISVCYYETYENETHLAQLLEENAEKIQCTVSTDAKYENSFRFGEAQVPKLEDFADGIDTMFFLMNL